MIFKKVIFYFAFVVGLSLVVSESPVYVFQAHSYTLWNPPDGALAVGVNRIVSAVNGQIRVFNKNSRTVLDTRSLTQFVGRNDAYDPRLVYDNHNDRFVFSCVNGRSGGSSFIELVVSKTGNPSSLTSNDWFFFSINSGESDLWADFPMMGIDRYNIYITANMFSNNGVFAGSRTNPLWVIRKNVYTNVLSFVKKELPGNVQKFSAQPAWNWDSSARNYLINKSGNTVLNIWELTNTQGGNPTITVRSINAPAQPFDNTGVAQLGTTLRVGAGDGRLNNAQIINGKLYTAHTLGNADTDGVNEVDIGKFIKWYQINLSNLSLEDDGVILSGSREYFFGGIGVDKDGNMGMTMVGSSPQQYISMYYGYKLASESSDNTAVRTRAILGKSGHSLYGNPRYGDYSAVALDPSDKQRFWVLNQIPSASNQWNSYIVSFCPGCDVNPEPVGCTLECGVGGECILNQDGTQFCECSTGYLGSTCNQCEETYYKNSEGKCIECGCLNGGICGVDGKCFCVNGFSGDECEIENIENCDICVNGIKLDDGDCKCFSGFTGKNCNECKETHFQVGRDCFEADKCEGEFEDGFCICSEITTGAFCEKCLIDNCEEFCIPECGAYQECKEDFQDEKRVCKCKEGRSGFDCSWCITNDCEGCPDRSTFNVDRAYCSEDKILCFSGFTTDSNGILCNKCHVNRYGDRCRLCPECPKGTRCDEGIDGSGQCIP